MYFVLSKLNINVNFVGNFIIKLLNNISFRY